MLIDTHAHIHDEKFSGEEDLVVNRAREAGVGMIITIGTSVRESRDALALAKKYRGVFATVGIHPHEFSALENDPQSLEKVREMTKSIHEMTQDDRVVAIGEIGLDYFSPDPDRPVSPKQKILQQTGFSVQWDMAQKIGLTPVIHCRSAFEELLRFLKTKRLLGPVVLHCYGGDTEVTLRFLEYPDIYFSFAGNITYPTKKIDRETKEDISQTIRMIPVERVLCETDAPYLAPQKVRGKRNEPAYIHFTIEKLADFYQKPIIEVQQQLWENATKAFRGKIVV